MNFDGAARVGSSVGAGVGVTLIPVIGKFVKEIAPFRKAVRIAAYPPAKTTLRKLRREISWGKLPML